MSDSTPGLPPAGWYSDPAGGPMRRWWDGTRWTERIETPTGTIDPAVPAATPVATPGTSPSTWPMWVIALLPLLWILSIGIVDLTGYLRTIFQAAVASEQPGTTVTPTLGPTIGIAALIGLVSIAAFIVFAFLDWRSLRTRGVERPFHWAFAFIGLINGGSLVYVIGRTVVAHRRTGRSASAPMWVYIGLLVVAIIVGFVKLAAAVASITPLLNQLAQTSTG